MTETRITPIDYVPSTEPSLKTAVTVVIPCFNESAGIEFLANRLREISDQYRDQHEFFFILVDDGSSDNTWELLGEQFSEWSNTELLRHAQNKGLMAAILTGTSAASTEIVCSMDSDCTFDPAQIPSMVEKLKEDVAMVTSSPYHPQGKVNNVPAWRIFLSRIASRLYRLILRNRLYCYTSCFRVFRRSVVGEIELQNPGFVGTAELVWRIEQQQTTIGDGT